MMKELVQGNFIGKGGEATVWEGFWNRSRVEIVQRCFYLSNEFDIAQGVT